MTTSRADAFSCVCPRSTTPFTPTSRTAGRSGSTVVTEILTARGQSGPESIRDRPRFRHPVPVRSSCPLGRLVSMIPELEWTDLDRKAVDTARVLAMDAVQKVGNGHPGTAMSLAPAAYLLFQKWLRHDPSDPNWVGRDRFVLSMGHSSLTLYVQLYLSGYGMELDDLQALRTWGSQTPGHPEVNHTPGVETTTGPLGQGVGNAVGMAMAARRERGLFDPEAPEGE